MAEMEDETSTDVTETEETETTETEEAHSPKDEYTYDEVVAMEARLKKAEAALVEKKREAKAIKQKAEGEAKPESNSFVTKQEILLERFIDKNPELEDYKDDIQKYVGRGNSLEEAKLLVLNSPAVVNREKTKKTSISFSEGGARLTSFTKDQLANMSQTEYNNARELMKSGKATLK